MQPRDLVRIRHMLEAAREARQFAEGRHRADLDQDRMLVLAIIRCIEIIGEAASRVEPETRAEHSGVPWTEAVVMRNRLIHAYFDVDLDRVWDTVSDDLPALISELERILTAVEVR
jgi:uncharacterized protein with HEPN domain